MAKPQNGGKLIECHSEPCNNGNFFHMSCLNYKRMPNNAKTIYNSSRSVPLLRDLMVSL